MEKLINVIFSEGEEKKVEMSLMIECSFGHICDVRSVSQIEQTMSIFPLTSYVLPPR